METIRQLTAVVKQGNPVTPAEEWILDNFYLIEENIRTAKRQLSRGYSRSLPWLRTGLHQDYPAFTTSHCSHGHGRVDSGKIDKFCHGLPVCCSTENWANCGPFRSCCAWRSIGKISRRIERASWRILPTGAALTIGQIK